MGFSAARILDDGRIVGGYATIWAVEDHGKYSTAELSTSRKTQDGQYETDFANKFVRLVGPAHEMGKGITGMTRIQIRNCDVTRYWSAEKEKEYINFVIFEFDFLDGAPTKKTTKKYAKKQDDFMDIPDDSEDAMPWD